MEHHDTNSNESAHDHHPPNPSAKLMQRIVAAVSVAFALVIMASVFHPGETQADSGAIDTHGDHSQDGHHDHGHADHDHADSDHQDHDAPEGSETLSSGEQLFFMGSLEDVHHTIELYVCNGDLRYSVINNGSGATELAYATRADVMALLPHIHLPDYAETNGTTQVMHAGDSAATIH